MTGDGTLTLSAFDDTVFARLRLGPLCPMLSDFIMFVVIAVPGPEAVVDDLAVDAPDAFREPFVLTCPVAGKPLPFATPLVSRIMALDATGGALLKERAGVLASSTSMIIHIPIFPLGPCSGVQ